MRRIVTLLFASGLAMPALAGEGTVVPLLWESPACAHDKLGSIEIELGERVSEITQDPNVPMVDYGRAMTKLASAAAAEGANAVVLRWHQGVYFTRNGKQSRRPVYVKLRGAAIRLDDAAQCMLQPVQLAELEARSRSDEAVNVNSREAFAGE